MRKVGNLGSRLWLRCEKVLAVFMRLFIDFGVFILVKGGYRIGDDAVLNQSCHKRYLLCKFAKCSLAHGMLPAIDDPAFIEIIHD